MRRLFVILSLLSLAVGVSAQLLWKVAGKGAAKPSYILGTHHLAPISMIDSIPGLLPALDACKHFYGEIDMNSANPQSLNAQSMRKVVMPPDTTWQQILPAEAIAKVDSFFVAQGVPADQVAHLHNLKPAFVGTQMAIILSLKYIQGFDPQRQFDKEIHKMAMLRGMTSAGFESSDSQIDLLFGSPLFVQAEELVDDLNNDSIAADIQTMTNVYVSRDFEGIARLVEKSRNSDVARRASERIVYRRNENWAEQLKTILPEGGAFISVGAGHLPGERGLLALLRKQGYIVTPVE